MTKLDFEPLEIKEEFDGGIENNSKLLTNTVKRCICYGRSFCGKTYNAVKWFFSMIHPPIGGIYIIAKNPDQPCFDALRKWAEKKDVEVFEDEEFTDELFDQMREDKAPKFLLYDDLTDQDDTANLVNAFKFLRHYNVYCVVICQDYKAVPKQCRTNATSYMIFNLSAPHVARSIASAMASSMGQDGKDKSSGIMRGYDFINNPENLYSWMFIQLDHPMSFIFTPEGDVIDVNSGCIIDEVTNDTKGKKMKRKKKQKKEEEEEPTSDS